MPPANRTKKRTSSAPDHSAHATGSNPQGKPDESYAEQQGRLADEGRGGPPVSDNDDDNEG
jgi:hypothetical protein